MPLSDNTIFPILILSVVLATVTVALTSVFSQFFLTGRAIDLILDKGNVDFPGILAIAKEGVIVIGITAAAQWIMNMCNNRMTYNIVRDIRRDAFERIEHLPLSYIDSHSHGDMVSRIVADVDMFWEIVPESDSCEDLHVYGRRRLFAARKSDGPDARRRL